MLRSQLDHIVTTAPSLAIGVDYVRQALGVTPQMGGVEHPGMGTHACFWKLGEKTYLEVIAVNPNASEQDLLRAVAAHGAHLAHSNFLGHSDRGEIPWVTIATTGSIAKAYNACSRTAREASVAKPWPQC